MNIGGTVVPWSIYFTDANTGYWGGAAKIQKTTNGGVNWTDVLNVAGMSMEKNVKRKYYPFNES